MRNLFLLLISLLQTGSLFSQDDSSKVVHGMGAIPIGTTEYKKLRKIKRSDVTTRVPPPLKFYIETPPVGDQGYMGSCVGWAVGYTFFSSFIRKVPPLTTPPPPRPLPVMIWNEYNELSPSYLFNQIRVNPGDCRQGSNVMQALNYMQTQGNVPIKVMPYVLGDCNTQPTAAQRKEASRYQSFSRSWYAANPRDYILLMSSLFKYRRPIVVVLPVYQEFFDMWNYKGGMWTRNPVSDLKGYHAVCVTGYDARKKLFQCQNQWGAGGGDSGYFWVTFDLVTAGCFIEAYIWTGDNPNPAPVPFPKPVPGGLKK